MSSHHHYNNHNVSGSTAANDYSELKWPAAPPLDGDQADEEEENYSNVPPTVAPSSEGVAQQGNTSSSSSNGANTDTTTTSPNFLPLQAERTALLVVDVQPEYWSQCPAVRRDFPHFPSSLARTVQICRERQVAQIMWVRADYRYAHSPWLRQFARIHGLQPPDTHQAAAASVGVTHQEYKKSKHMRAEVVCDPASEEFAWEDFAVPQGSEVVLPKSSWSSTSNAALMDLLRASGVDTVLVCGLITSVCVQHSAFGIFEAGFRTILVTDACADRGRARHEAALALYGDYMYELVDTTRLSQELRPAKPVFLGLLPTSVATTTTASSSSSPYSNGHYNNNNNKPGSYNSEHDGFAPRKHQHASSASLSTATSEESSSLSSGAYLSSSPMM